MFFCKRIFHHLSVFVRSSKNLLIFDAFEAFIKTQLNCCHDGNRHNGRVFSDDATTAKKTGASGQEREHVSQGPEKESEMSTEDAADPVDGM